MENTERRRRLGQSIRAERESQNLSQRKLAHMMGKDSHSYLSAIERGETNAGFDEICGIADALGVEVSYFFTTL